MKSLTGDWLVRINAAGELVLTVLERDDDQYSYRSAPTARDATVADLVLLGRGGRLLDKSIDISAVSARIEQLAVRVEQMQSNDMAREAQQWSRP